MTLQDSVKTCFSKYAEFGGQATRSEFWWFFLFTLIASTIISFISANLGGIFSLAVLVPSLAVGARRLNDTQRSPWLLLLLLIPLFGFLALCYFWAQAGNSEA